MAAKLSADSFINEMAKAANGETEPEPSTETGGTPDPGVDAETIVAPGVVFDKYSGKSWALPTDAMADVGALLHKSPRDIKKDPRFHYEFHGCKAGPGSTDEYASMLGQGFVPVTREELGLEDLKLSGELASPMDKYYVIDGTDMCFKIPVEFAKGRYDALSEYSKAALNATRKGTITTADGTESDNLEGTRDLPVERKLTNRTDNREPTKGDLA